MLPTIALAMLAVACRPEATSAPAPAAPPVSAVPSSAPPASPAAPRERSPAAASTPAPPPPWPARPLPVVETDWCIDGLETLDEETCVVLPKERTQELLIYLHGIVPPQATSVQKTNFETVVASASRRAGVVALIPRGKQGLAPKGHERWWGWPTASPTYRRLGEGFAQALRDKQAKLESFVGLKFDRVYLAGSSSGAYFVAALALHGGFIADGYGAMSGGAGSATPELATLRPRPFYIGFGTHDSVSGSARALGKVLADQGWPVRIAAHPLPHGAREVYLDEAFAFWREHAH